MPANHQFEKYTVILRGHVQGVGMRYSVQSEANSLGIKGTVSNNWDGSVTIQAQCNRAILDRLIKTLTAPTIRFWRIDTIDISESPTLPDFTTFRIV